MEALDSSIPPVENFRLEPSAFANRKPHELALLWFLEIDLLGEFGNLENLGRVAVLGSV